MPWRPARRGSGLLMVVGIRGGCSGSGGVWRDGLSRYVDVCVVLGWCGSSARCRVVSWLRSSWSRGVTGACAVGVLWWAFFRGALVVFWRPVHENGGHAWGVE